jgi:hypothetical protein
MSFQKRLGGAEFLKDIVVRHRVPALSMAR